MLFWRRMATLAMVAVFFVTIGLVCWDVKADTSTATGQETDVSVSSRKTMDYDGFSSSCFQLSNGHTAFCMEFANTHPEPEHKITDISVFTEDNTSMVYKILYYGWEGPEQWAGFLDDERIGITTTGVALSYETTGVPDYFFESTTFTDFYNYVKGAPDPPVASIQFNPSNPSTTVDGGAQVTEWITLEADSRLSVTLNLDDGIILYFKGDSTPYSGSVDITGGSIFYLEAPADRAIGFAANVVYSGDKLFKVMQAVPELADKGYQRMAYRQNQEISAHLGVEFKPSYGKIRIRKKSSNKSITDNNECYNLSGAVFGVFASEEDAIKATKNNENAVAVLITDENGCASSEKLPYGTYFIKETKAPCNYMIDSTVYTVVSSGVELEISNEPVEASLDLLIKKLDENGNGLEDAEFMVKYYDLQMDENSLFDPAQRQITPKRIWIFKSDSEGRVFLKDSYKIWGGDLYCNQVGETVLPVGTITIQETKAPAGYYIDDKVYVQSVRSENTDFEKPLYNETIITDYPFPPEEEVILVTQAKDSLRLNNSSEVSQNTTLVDTVYYENVIPNREYIIETTLMDKETGNPITVNGQIITKSSKLYITNNVGTVDIQVTFDSSELFGKSVVFFEKLYCEGTLIAAHTDINAMGQTIIFDPLPGQIKIHKTGEGRIYNDSQNEFQEWEINLQGIEFGIYAEEDIVDIIGNVVYKKGDVVETIITDINGDAISSDNLLLGKYRIHEENTPVGYIPSEDRIVELSINSPRKCIYNTDGVEKQYACEELDIKNEIIVPTISTMAKDSVRLNNTAMPSAETILVDTVAYKNLIVGKEYAVRTVLMDKETGKSLLLKGREVESVTRFVPEASDGSVDIRVPIDSSNLFGKSLVFFEELYCDGMLVAKHKEIGDMGQTVIFDSLPGQIRINKVGDKRVYDEDSGKFKTGEINLSDIEFEIYAAENIKDAAGSIIYNEGTLVESINTNEKGDAKSSDNLPLGKYRVHEKNTPEMYIPMEDKIVELSLESDRATLVGKDGVSYQLAYTTLNIRNKLIIPEISTKARDGVRLNNTAMPGQNTKLMDTITYKNLIPNKSYTLKTTLIEKETGKLIVFDEKKLVKDITFIPEKSEGEIDVSVEVDGTSLYGKSVVFFERLYCENEIVAIHEEIGDKGQTIVFDELTGQIEIHKLAEKRTYNEKTKKYDMEKISMEGIKFDIYAEEDIVDKSNNMLYKEKTLVETIVTDESGYAYSSNRLPLGTYKIREKNTPKGYVTMEDRIIKISEDGKRVVSKDVNGNDIQVVYYELEVDNELIVPQISTKARDSVSLKNLAKQSEKTILIDSISYENLIPSQEYIIETVLMDKDTKKPLSINGKEIRRKIKFTPEKSDGKKEVSVKFDSSDLYGKSVVFYERLYCENILVALHEDINSVNQTITFEEEPPMTTETPPVTTEEILVTTEIPVLTTVDATTEIMPVVPNEPPVFERPPATTETPPITTENPPVTSEQPPVITEEPPVITEEPPLTTETPPEIPPEPTTGDSVYVIIAFFIILTSGIGLCALCKYKTKK